MHNGQQLRAHAKRELRRTMRSTRGLLPDNARAVRSNAIAESLAQIAELNAARTIAGFMAIHGEVDLEPWLLTRMSQQTIALPRVDREVDQLVFHRWDGADLNEGAFGVREPEQDAPLVDPRTVDFVLVPALAVDARGYRVGYGRGYYDRALPQFTQAVSCAVVYDFQLVMEVPREAHDAPVDLVVSDARVIDTRDR